jgi:hypothetical protein
LKPITFTCSLRAIDIQCAGVMATTFALGQQQHRNIIFKKLALGFIDELVHRVKDEPQPNLSIDFADATVKEIHDAIVATLILGVQLAGNRDAYRIIEGLGECLQQIYLFRTKPGEDLPASLTLPERTLN